MAHPRPPHTDETPEPYMEEDYYYQRPHVYSRHQEHKKEILWAAPLILLEPATFAIIR